MKRLPAAVVVTLLPLIILAGCSSSGGSSSSAIDVDRGYGIADSAPGFELDSRGGADASEASEEWTGDEAVITTGYTKILVDELTASTDKLIALVNKNSGRVESRSENPVTDYSEGTSSFVVRVPSSSVESFISGLKEIGETQELTIGERDVTLEYKDLTARIEALEAGVERLTTLLAQADSTETLIAIENAITDRQMELDSLKTQELYLKDQIAESTLNVTLVTKSEAAKKAPEDYLSGVNRGWESLVGFLTAAVIFLGLLTPWLLPLGALGAATLIVIHFKRRGKKGFEMETSPESKP